MLKKIAVTTQIILTVSIFAIALLDGGRLLFSSVTASSSSDEWLRRGLGGIDITAVIADPQTTSQLYVASRDSVGVRTSTDDGTSWNDYNRGLTSTGIEDTVSCSSGWLFAGSWGDGVFRRNANEQWSQKSGGISQLYITALACGTDTTVFAGTFEQGVFRSTNNGENWQAINDGLTERNILTLAYLADKGLFIGTNRGVFVRADTSSSAQPLGLANRTIYSLASLNNYLWAGTDQGVFRSPLTDVGNWSAVGALGHVVYSLNTDPDQSIYAGTQNNGVYRWDGSTWSAFNLGLSPNRVYALLSTISEQTWLWAGTSDGVWYNELRPVEPPLSPSPPTATVTETAPPTITPTLTATPTPTPGIKSIRLRNEPPGEIKENSVVTYIIEVENGPYPLTTVVVRNPIPEQMALVPDSVLAPTPWQATVVEDTVQWLQSEMAAGERVRLVYEARRFTSTSTPTPTITPTDLATLTPTVSATGTEPVETPSVTTTVPSVTMMPTPATPITGTPTSAVPTNTVTEPPSPTPTTTVTPNVPPDRLTITKSGPTSVLADADIVYVIRVTNEFTRSLTGLTIQDLIPVGAEVIDFGGGSMTMPPSPMIQWQVPLLNPQTSVTRTFAIRMLMSTNEVRNEVYFVDVIENGMLVMRATGEIRVITTISSGTIDGNFVYTAGENPFFPLSPVTNEGATVRWHYTTDPDYNGELLSNWVRNPFQQYMPIMIHEYSHEQE